MDAKAADTEGWLSCAPGVTDSEQPKARHSLVKLLDFRDKGKIIWQPDKMTESLKRSEIYLA